MTVAVIDDAAEPVPSEIFRITDTQEERYLADTDSITARARLNCTAGERLRARPHSSEFYYSKPFRCPAREAADTLEIVVSRKEWVANLRSAAALYELQSSWANAALAHTEYAARMAEVEPDSAQAAREAAFEAFGVFLEADTVLVFDLIQGVRVITPEFRGRILTFQDANGLAATGHLDFETLHLAATAEVWTMLTRPPVGRPD